MSRLYLSKKLGEFCFIAPILFCCLSSCSPSAKEFELEEGYYRWNYSNSFVCEDEILINNELSDEVNFYDQIGLRKSTLVLRIPEGSCASCYNRELSRLKDNLVTNKISRNAIFLITEFESNRGFLAFLTFLQTNRLPFRCFNLKDNLTLADKFQVPYYIVLDEQMKITKTLLTRKPKE